MPTTPVWIKAAAFLVAVWIGGVFDTNAAEATPLVVAHRGASGEAPENTLPAFKLAWEQGASAIEGDFRLTRDRRIVCIHDADTERVAGVRKVVVESSLAELQELDVGRWKDPKFKGVRIPTLEDVCATVPTGRKFFIEIKSGPEIVPLLLTSLDRSRLEAEQIVILSFHADVVQAVGKQRPNWTVNLLCGLNGGNGNGLDTELRRLIPLLRRTGADGLSTSSHLGLRTRHVKLLKEAGFDHHVWTINDTLRAQHFVDLGTQSITTDLPQAMGDWLANRSKRSQAK